MDVFFIFFSAMIGLIVGSFINCMVWRIYKDESILGRSYCPNCRKKINWYDNIPVLSYILLKAKCRSCKKRISWQYPLVEIFTSLLFVLSFIAVKDSADFALLLFRNWLLISSLILIFVYDLRFQLVPMILIWPLSIIMIIINLFLGFSWQIIGLAGLVGGFFFLIQYLITRGRGLGEGDIWLGILLGLSFASFNLLILSLVLSYFIGAIVSIFLLVGKKKKLKSKVALGPFLAFGAIISLIYGQKIISWYLGMF